MRRERALTRWLRRFLRLIALIAFGALTRFSALLDPTELLTPVAFECAGPFVQRPDGMRIRAIPDLSAVTPGMNEAHVAKNPQVFRDRRLRHSERIYDLADRPLVPGQDLEDRASLRFGNRVEHVRARCGTRHDRIIFPYRNMSSVIESRSPAGVVLTLSCGTSPRSNTGIVAGRRFPSRRHAHQSPYVRRGRRQSVAGLE
jgi:hypothetical protein